LELSNSELSVQAPKIYSKTDRRSRNYGTRHRKVIKFNSGFRSKAEMDHFIDLLRSEEIYLVQDSYYQPVTMKQTDIRLSDSETGRMNNVAIEVYPSKGEKYYSNGRNSL